MLTIQATGKSVDAAIYNGLNQLGLSIDEVNIEVIQRETKGILGIGSKPAIVKLVEKPKDEVVIPDFSLERTRGRRDNHDNRGRDERRQNARAERGEKPRRSTEQRPSSDIGAAPEKEPAAQQTREREIGNNAERGQSMKARGESRLSQPERERAPELNYTEQTAAGEPSAQFVSGLIERMKIDGKVLAAREDDTVRLRIDCGEMGVLIGHRGETLDAVQYLTGLVINRNRKVEGYTRVTINTEDYREKREETLVRLARRIASQVKSSGSPRTLEPMNPYERRIIHSALQKHPFVTTHSEGDEPNRRVVITPKQRQQRQGGYRRSARDHA